MQVLSYGSGARLLSDILQEVDRRDGRRQSKGKHQSRASS